MMPLGAESSTACGERRIPVAASYPVPQNPAYFRPTPERTTGSPIATSPCRRLHRHRRGAEAGSGRLSLCGDCALHPHCGGRMPARRPTPHRVAAPDDLLRRRPPGRRGGSRWYPFEIAEAGPPPGPAGDSILEWGAGQRRGISRRRPPFRPSPAHRPRPTPIQRSVSPPSRSYRRRWGLARPPSADREAAPPATGVGPEACGTDLP